MNRLFQGGYLIGAALLSLAIACMLIRGFSFVVPPWAQKMPAFHQIFAGNAKRMLSDGTMRHGRVSLNDPRQPLRPIN